MKETILDVLLYLFENFFYDDPDAVRDRDSLQSGLIQAGFSPAEVSKAFDWLDDLASQQPAAALDPAELGPVRLWADVEELKLDQTCRGFLMMLEVNGLLDANQRELVIDRAMALDQEEVDLEDLKWVVLMVLFNQPGAEAAYAWMESQMFEGGGEAVH